MAGVKIEVKMNNPKSVTNRILNKRDVGIFVATTWARYFDKYVPEYEGALKSDITIDPYEVTYNSPYAHYQWEGELYVSPTTGSSWARLGETKVPTGLPLTQSHEKNPLACAHWEEPAFDAFKDTVAKQVTAYLARKV